MGSAASWRGTMQGEDNQSNYVTRRHPQSPLVIRLLRTHQAQSAVVAVFGVKVKGHCCETRGGNMESSFY